MLAGKSIRHSSLLARAHLTKHALPLRSQRQLSSFTASKASFSYLSSRPIGRNGSGLLPSSSPAVRMAGSPPSARFLSSTAALSASQPVEASTTPTQTGNESVAEAPAPNLADIDLAQVQEGMGFLKALGLDYGWGPSTVVQLCLESVHVYGGLPWVPTVLVLSVAVRFLLMKFTADASDLSAKLQHLKPELQEQRDRMTEATRQGDNLKSMQLRQEMKLFNERQGIKMRRMFYPMIQLPIGFGFFRVLRGMGDLPVPSLDAESFLWLPSVASHDPYFILPVLTGSAVYFALKRGASVGTPNALMKYMVYLAPILSGVTSTFFPGILQIYFASTSLLMTIQTHMITQHGIRKFFNLQQFPAPTEAPEPRIRVIQTQAKSTPAPETHSAEKISIIDRAMDSAKSKYKTTTKDFRERMEKMAGEKKDGVAPRLSKAELEKANAYEKRRAEQIAMEREMRNRLQKSQHLRKQGDQEEL